MKIDQKKLSTLHWYTAALTAKCDGGSIWHTNDV